MTIKELESVTGALSKPSKMPCHGYSIPATRCKIGKKMHSVSGSICSKCYALKGRYVFGSVKNAMEKRYQSLKNPEWVDTMVELIRRKEKSGFFRWHDSGDLQDVDHLMKIIRIAKRLPHINFWLPTREYNIVKEAFRIGISIPENLTIRLSALMFDGEVTEQQNPFNLPTSGASEKGFTCPSHKQNNKCLDCRACWDKDVEVVTYKKH